MDFVQLYYFIFYPLGAILFVNIAFHVLDRPIVHNSSISDSLLFLLIILSTMISTMGVGVHSTSTSVYQAFMRQRASKTDLEEPQKDDEAYIVNEKYHGNLSHNLFYIGSILAFFFMALLEINHPNIKGIFPLTDDLIVATGIFIGLIATIAISWSAYSGFNIGLVFVSSFLTSLVLYFYAYPDMYNIVTYPLAFAMFAALVTLFTLLSIVSLIFIASQSLSQRFVKKTFPKGHAAHEGLHWKLLSLKIKRDWFE